MRKTALWLAILVMISFAATAHMAGDEPESDARPPAGGQMQSPQHYTVRTGDTLWDIAMRHKVVVSDLLTANRLPPGSVLAVGQTLLIPNRSGAAPTAPAVAKQPATARHVVQSGDTLWGIAMGYGVTTEVIASINRLGKASILTVGQTLVIPGPRRTPPPRPAIAAPPPASAIQTTAPLTATASLTATAPVQAAPEITPTQPISDVLPTESPPDIVQETPALAPAQASIEITATAALTPTLEPTPPPVEPPPPPPPAPTLPPAIADWPQIIFDLINEKRAAHGLPPLAWSPLLAQAAQTHAEDCGRRQFGSHVGSDGAKLRARLERAGYSPSYASENWVFARSPQGAVEWWYDEPPGRDPHRRNILARQYTEVGVGVAFGEGGHFYFITDFGRP